MTKLFKWGFIGCGGVAESVAKELKQSDKHQIVALWNRTLSRAERFSERFGGTVYERVEDLLNDSNVDGVYIAVTADRHAEFMKLCIAHKKPVLCEKPFTVNAKEAQEVIEYARQEGVYVSEAMWTWHNDVAKQVKNWIKEDRFGQVQDVEVSYSLPMIWNYGNPRLTSIELIGGAVMDIGVYSLRYCYELFGYPQNITCTGELKDGVDLNEEIILDYGDFKARLYVGINGSRGEHFLLFGENGTLHIKDFHMARSASVFGKEEEIYQAEHQLLFLRQADIVTDEILSGQLESEISLGSTLDVMNMLDDCRRQLGVIYLSEKEKETK
ncbi:Gfo/Idh/MocA family protein [Streptococcus sp. S784/96/1]|uniref:Gfo/Idh/MocA family protein n=1 Tax=Streptococcus sp. S784/96/1 TaxID=2653499 RepID=UPI00138A4B4B|nr:Gfo/Idh/MocA family oxidoreductase [Streptococcus sp. S784/96/1]